MSRGLQASLGGLGLTLGLVLLYFKLFWPGIVILSIGCLSLEWSIGGFGGGGCGASDS